MSVVDAYFDQPLKLEESAAAPLAGGILTHGYQCGMLWGASLAAGAEAYQRFGPGPQAEIGAILATQRALESFRARTKNEINCIAITELNFQENAQFLPILKFFVKGGNIGVGACFRLAAGYAPQTANDIESALSAEDIELIAPPLSCAAVLAQKMGASAMHATMAAGFAGGIGLSGGACGALGAAIWITAMNRSEDGSRKLDFFNSAELQEVIDRFVECTGCEFECSQIVGREFEDIADHAGYLRAGGCSQIIEALAAQPVG